MTRTRIRTDRRKLHAIKLCAPSDPSGNPRRVYLIVDRDGYTVDALDIGYSGTGALTDGLNPGGYRYQNVRERQSLDITYAEYKRLLKWKARRREDD